jgi:hypothetical protein
VVAEAAAVRRRDTCEQCGSTDLTSERGSLGSFWRRQAIQLDVLTCGACGRVMLYRAP